MTDRPILFSAPMIRAILCAVEAAPFFQAVVEDITARPEACRFLTGAECIASAQQEDW